MKSASRWPWFWALMAAAALVTAPVSAQVAGITTPEPPVVVVSGEGVVKAVPDQAWVRIGAETRSKSPKDAQTANAGAMAEMQRRLSATGIPKDAVRTVAYEVQMEYDYANGRQTPRGYVARNSIEVRVDDLTRLGEVLDASVGSGATSVNQLRFDLKQRDALEREALQRAVADAMQRAEAAAAGAKRSVDRVIRIEEAGRQSAPPPMMAMRATADEARPVTPIASGELEIRAQVTVTVAIR